MLSRVRFAFVSCRRIMFITIEPFKAVKENHYSIVLKFPLPQFHQRSTVIVIIIVNLESSKPDIFAPVDPDRPRDLGLRPDHLCGTEPRNFSSAGGPQMPCRATWSGGRLPLGRKCGAGCEVPRGPAGTAALQLSLRLRRCCAGCAAATPGPPYVNQALKSRYESYCRRSRRSEKQSQSPTGPGLGPRTMAESAELQHRLLDPPVETVKLDREHRDGPFG